MRGDDLIARIQEEWPLIENQFDVTNHTPCRFVFRTSLTLNLATERKVKDPRAVHLFFIEVSVFLDRVETPQLSFHSGSVVCKHYL